MPLVTYDQVESKIIALRGQKVLLDSDVAKLYEVETKAINQAVKRNIEKFPDGYILELTEREWNEVRSQIVTSPLGGGRAYKPRAFTERGLYMLATILKSPKATHTTIAIIDAFAKVKEISRVIKQLPQTKEGDPKHEVLTHKTRELISDLFIPEELQKTETETSIELNLAVVKFKYAIKRK